MSRVSRTEHERFALEVKVLTPKAVLLSDSVAEAWVPLSMLGASSGPLTRGEVAEVSLPVWLAKRKGFL